MKNLKQRHMHYCETKEEANQLAGSLWKENLDFHGDAESQEYPAGKETISDWLDIVEELQSPHTLYAVEHITPYDVETDTFYEVEHFEEGNAQYEQNFFLYERIDGDLRCMCFIDLEDDRAPRLFFQIINEKSKLWYRECVWADGDKIKERETITSYFKILENSNETNLKDLCIHWQDLHQL